MRMEGSLPDNTSVEQHFFPINTTTIWNALPYDVLNRRRVNTFKNRLDTHWEDNPQMCRTTVTLIDVQSIVWSVVVLTWFGGIGQTIRYITTDLDWYNPAWQGFITRSNTC